MNQPLDPEAQALWAKVAATVRRLDQPRHGRPPGRALEQPLPRPETPVRPGRIGRAPFETLDGSWDRRLAQGRADPQMVIDLHGLTCERARQILYQRLHTARQRAFRVVLVITGKGNGGNWGSGAALAPADLVPGLSGGQRPRGGIRAELPRWLGEAELGAGIAAVRKAHPRHGGDGAVYLILRR